jgi:predicted unusual protein kinase regulating ubiquinone biosynthesis (AarF/ABC1/UbiB family)
VLTPRCALLLLLLLLHGYRAKGYGGAVKRAIGIWSFALRILWQEGKLRKEKDLAVKAARRAVIAVQLREGLLALGPTFIKLGESPSLARHFARTNCSIFVLL